jgi:two-component system sensor histidine kinase QseC
MKRPRLPHSLQGRLLLLVLAAVTVVWGFAAVATWVDAREELDELFDAHLAQAAALLIARQAGEIDDDDEPVDSRLLHRYAPKVAFQVWHEGRLALRSANAPPGRMSARATGFATVRIDGHAWRVFGARGSERDIQVYVGEQIASRAAVLRALMESLLVPMLVALPVVALAAWLAVRMGIAPLRRFSATLARTTPHALQPILHAGAAELAPLVAALNGLLERIAALLDSERRFTADAAHELRTPIAAIRAQAQVAAAATHDAERRRALDATLSGCDRVARLVEQLLMLARLEAAAPEGTVALVDLSAVTREVLAAQAGQAVAKGQTIELDAAAPCIVQGDEVLVAVLVRNLVDNAIRYSPPAATIQVRVMQTPGRIALCVEDSGPGLSDAERARLGERFYRPPGSEESGSGLGWSIVQRIVAAQRAALEVGASPALGGLRVLVTWPLPRSTATPAGSRPFALPA